MMIPRFLAASLIGTTMLLTACVPTAIPAGMTHGNGSHATRLHMPRPEKPPLPPPPLPPNVIKVVNPDGSISITIREPRCPNCQPWGY